MKNSGHQARAVDPPWKILKKIPVAGATRTAVSDVPPAGDPGQVKAGHAPLKQAVSAHVAPQPKAFTTTQSPLLGKANAEQNKLHEEEEKKAGSASPVMLPADTKAGNKQVKSTEIDAPTASQGGDLLNRAKAWNEHVSDHTPPKMIGIAVTSLAFCAAIWAASRRPAMPSAPQFKMNTEPAF